MNFKTLSYLLILLLVISGCTTKEKVTIEVIDEFANAPTWVKAPKLEKYINDVGSSSASNESFIVQRDEAIEDAKANLYRKITKQISNIFHMVGKNHMQDELYLQRIEDANNELVSNAINEARVTKLWKSDKNNIYIMVSSDISKLKKDLHAMISTSFKDFKTIESEYRLLLEQGNIDIELNN
jgi:hypothetical protein